MKFRTDLALERHEFITEEDKEGLSFDSYETSGMKISKITVKSEGAAKKLSKPCGKYITMEIPFLKDSADLCDEAVEIFAKEISSLITPEGTVLVAGLGNRDITPEALGPECIERLLATRHITPEVAKAIGFSSLRSVAGIIPGVLGNTGIETAELLSGVVYKVRPSVLVVIDALAARNVERLGTTVQMCDTGVSPGAGVGNRRSTVDEKSMGVPVIAIGVPTVVDAVTMTLDLIDKTGIKIDKNIRESSIKTERGMMVTPKEIDSVISRSAAFIAAGLNKAFQPHISVADILAIMA